jgi:type II secretory pathway pseudopilin PulG
MSSERGEFNLVGVLVAASLMIVVLSATLTTFNGFYQGQSDQQKRVEADDRARVAVDQMAREMRNLATPTNLDPAAVDLATAYDMVFETVAPTLPAGGQLSNNPTNVERVRYCLSTPAADGTRSLYRMEQLPSALAAGTAMPSTSACPGAGWSNARAMAAGLTNTYGGQGRPAFSFNSATLNLITRVHADLFVDIDPTHGPAEQEISTGVYLRNQDRPPTAAFTWSTTSGVATLNASPSSDPDNDPMAYCWYDAGFAGSFGSCGAGSIGDTPVVRYRTTSGSHTFTLTVSDPSGLSATVSHQVTVP